MNSFNIFVDFDGTITLNDVGDTLFATFADESWKKAVQDWKDGLISSKECLLRECSITKVTRRQLEQFCDCQQIDPHFKEFVQYCKENGYPVTILSDGLDFYIQRILENNGLGFLTVYANKLIFKNENKICPEFPYYGKGCPGCANCKGYHINESRKDGELVVYIGDGLSDRCAVVQADIIFAKDDLRKYCLQKNLPFYDYQNFNDVLHKLKQ